MNQPNILELARQGDPNAIAALMNAVLEPKGITARASLENDCLSVFLESAKTLNQQTLTAFIHKGLLELGTSIKTVKTHGQKPGSSSDWVTEFLVHSIAQTTPGIAEVEDVRSPLSSAEIDQNAENLETQIDSEETDAQPPLTTYLQAYAIPTLLVMTVAFLSGGIAAFLSTSKITNQAQETESAVALLGERPRSPQEMQKAAENYLKAMNAAQEKFYRENDRFAKTLEELERSANLITQSYDYVYKLKIINANRAQVTAVSKEKGLRSYVGTVVVAQSQTASLICRTDQPSLDAPPMPESSQNKLQCQPSSSPVR